MEDCSRSQAMIDYHTSIEELRWHAENVMEKDGRIHIKPELLSDLADIIEEKNRIIKIQQEIIRHKTNRIGKRREQNNRLRNENVKIYKDRSFLREKIAILYDLLEGDLQEEYKKQVSELKQTT